MALQQPLL